MLQIVFKFLSLLRAVPIFDRIHSEQNNTQRRWVRLDRPATSWNMRLEQLKLLMFSTKKVHFLRIFILARRFLPIFTMCPRYFQHDRITHGKITRRCCSSLLPIDAVNVSGQSCPIRAALLEHHTNRTKNAITIIIMRLLAAFVLTSTKRTDSHDHDSYSFVFDS